MDVRGSAFCECVFAIYLVTAILFLTIKSITVFMAKSEYYVMYLFVTTLLLLYHLFLCYINEPWRKIYHFFFGYFNYHKIRKLQNISSKQQEPRLSKMFSLRSLSRINDKSEYDESEQEEMMIKRNLGIKKGREKITLWNCFDQSNIRDDDERSWMESSRKYTMTLEDSQEMQELMGNEEKRKKHLSIKFRETLEKYEEYVEEIGRSKEREKQYIQKTKKILSFMIQESLKENAHNIQAILITLYMNFNVQITTQIKGIQYGRIKRKRTNIDAKSMTFNEVLRMGSDGSLRMGKWKNLFFKEKTSYQYEMAVKLLENEIKKRVILDRRLNIEWNEKSDENRNKAIEKLKKMAEGMEKGEKIFYHRNIWQEYDEKVFLLIHLMSLFNILPDLTQSMKIHFQPPEDPGITEYVEVVLENCMDMHLNLKLWSTDGNRKVQRVYHCKPGNDNIYSIFSAYLRLLSGCRLKLVDNSALKYFIDLYET